MVTFDLSPLGACQPECQVVGRLAEEVHAQPASLVPADLMTDSMYFFYAQVMKQE